MKKMHRPVVMGLMVWSGISGVASAQAPANQAPANTETKTEAKSKGVAIADAFEALDETLAAILEGNQEERDKAVAASPNDPKVYEERGYYYFKQKMYDKALADYQKALQLNPKSVSVHEELADVYRQQKDVKNALAEYDKAIALEKPEIYVLLHRAAYLAELGRKAEALNDYNQAIALQPTSWRGYDGRARFYVAQQQLDNALSDYNKTVELDPKTADRYIGQGQVLRSLKRTDEAIGSFNKALALNSESTSALNELGATYLETKSYDMALDSFNRSLALKDLSLTYIMRGKLLFSQNKRGAALTDFNKVIAAETKLRDRRKQSAFNEWWLSQDGVSDLWLAEAYFYRSLINGRSLSLISKDADKAPVIADATMAVQLNPGLAQDYIQHIGTLSGNADAKYTIATLLAGVAAAKPDDITILLKLAEAQSAALDSKSAIITYGKALKLNPQSPPALSGRAGAYRNRAVPYKAEDWLPIVNDWKSYLALKPDDGKAWQQLGIAQYNVAQTAEGIATFRRLLATEKENAYAHLMLALGLAINGDKDGALAEARSYMQKLTPGGMEEAKSNAGNATTHYPQNEAVKALYELIPGEEEEDEVDPATILFL